MYDKNVNPLHEIAIVSFVLGSVISANAVSLVLGIWEIYYQVPVYVIIISVYYMMEFITTSRFQTARVTSKLFLIYGNRGNKQFLLVQTLTMWEYFFRHSHFWPFTTGGRATVASMVTMVAGLSMIVAGLSIRYTAMKTCGSSFSHIIVTDGEEKLVTHGIYALTRHPSYLGFWMFSVGGQLFMGNFLVLVATIATLTYFFKVRIEFEEWFLVHKLFHNEYLEYRSKVGIWIPFVRVKDPES